eukprot:NODE_26865_length_534_cov_4.589681.p4 GENE.NODE_26865_length_534_cov_4.589681~~NODE_26865_length_534_cov_4.589681.p4  ORF type:complete len:64 (-),score=8.52 NODE_26865_length_534_cov_4.589681:36-227(-)
MVCVCVCKTPRALFLGGRGPPGGVGVLVCLSACDPWEALRCCCCCSVPKKKKKKKKYQLLINI